MLSSSQLHVESEAPLQKLLGEGMLATLSPSAILNTKLSCLANGRQWVITKKQSEQEALSASVCETLEENL